MELPLTPFSKLEYERKYDLHEFQERGLPFAFLVRRNQRRINSGNKYSFGLIDKDGKYFWFFYGKALCRDRKKAIETYQQLLNYCKEKDLGRPFAFKE